MSQSEKSQTQVEIHHEISLQRLQRERKPDLSIDYVVYLDASSSNF